VVNDRLRIADADRETAARELGEHFALGRISADEHAERLEQIWSARTAADLAPAFRDLPRAEAARPTRVVGSTGDTARRGRGWRLDVPHIPFPLKVLVAIVAIWWGLHHLLFLVVGIAVYVVVVRRFVRHFDRHFDRHRGWRGRARSWDHSRYQAGWH
jgi:Flp pilus assembly protein TadB